METANLMVNTTALQITQNCEMQGPGSVVRSPDEVRDELTFCVNVDLHSDMNSREEISR